MCRERLADHRQRSRRCCGDKAKTKPGCLGQIQALDNAWTRCRTILQQGFELILLGFVNALDFQVRQSTAGQTADPTLSACRCQQPTIGRDVPVPVQTMSCKGRVIGTTLQLRGFCQHAD